MKHESLELTTVLNKTTINLLLHATPPHLREETSVQFKAEHSSRLLSSLGPVMSLYSNYQLLQKEPSLTKAKTSTHQNTVT